MAKDGTNRGGRRVRAGAKPDPLKDKLEAGKPASRLLEAYAQAFARYIQCEEAISKFGLLGKHPTTGAAIASPFVAMNQSFSKQVNVYWYEIYEIVRAISTHEYVGSSPGDDLMERLLQSRTQPTTASPRGTRSCSRSARRPSRTRGQARAGDYRTRRSGGRDQRPHPLCSQD